jgi:hypothetical protein
MKINGVKVHPRITEEVILEAVERSTTSLDNPGLCIACGEEVYGIEPDAEGYACEACGAEEAVYGAEELLLRIA